MTYTFKLSRRLAVSRARATLAIGVVLTACTNDATGPDAPASGAPFTPTSFRVVPATVTVETNQPIRFRGATSAGDVFGSRLLWQASGGSIDAEGNFTASAPGTYKVVGRTRGRQRPDTSVVVVVPPQPDLAAIQVAPDPVSLDPGAVYTFSASGRLADGSTVQVGVNWSATGGSIDASGAYKAGATAGTYRVVATHTNGALADTAAVTIEAEEAPPPPPATPTLAQVVLKPGSVSLATGEVKQFAVFGRDSNGDSIAVAANFAATGGTISGAGVYTAGQVAGTFRVVAVASGLADTAVVTLTAPEVPPPPPPPPPPADGAVPYGAFAAWSGTSLKANSDYFTMGTGADNASGIIARIDAARRAGKKILMVMTGGDHGNYLSVIDGQLRFDRNKWNAKMQTFNTVEIRRAVAAGVADGVIVGNSVMDEPHVSGGGDGNTWGPVGTMTKARVDELCGYVKQIFPTLPVGVVHRHDIFEPTTNYRTCDFLISQYSNRLGSVSTFRDGGLAFARRSGVAIAFSMNIINGGVQDTDGNWDCTGTGGKGTYSPNCRMTPTQVREYGQALGQSGCAMFMWRYDDLFMANSNNQAAFKAVADLLARQPRTLCTRA